MLKVGLTGAIGSGKTTVSHRFAAHGVPVLDADTIARELVEPGQPALARITQAFGRDVLDSAGRLVRARLRGIIFADPARRAALEAILHPLVRAAMTQRVAALRAPYCILVIPLLIESGMTDLVDRVLVVDVPERVQYHRIRVRDKLSEPEIRAIVGAQASSAERLARADDVIVNDGDLERLYRQVDAMHHYYNELARPTTEESSFNPPTK